MKLATLTTTTRNPTRDSAGVDSHLRHLYVVPVDEADSERQRWDEPENHTKPEDEAQEPQLEARNHERATAAAARLRALGPSAFKLLKHYDTRSRSTTKIDALA